MEAPKDKYVSNRELIRFFQSRLASLSAETAHKYARVISDLDIFLTGHHLRLAEMTEVMATDWAYDLLRGGLAKSTVVRHLNILNSLLNVAVKKGLLGRAADSGRASESAPRVVARKIERGELMLPPLLNEETFDGCISLLRNALRRSALGAMSEAGAGGEVRVGGKTGTSSEAGEMERAEDVLLYSLLNGARPLRELIMLKKSDAGRSSEASKGIVEKNLDARRAFVFNLRQSFYTPKQLLSKLSATLEQRYGEFLGKGCGFDVDRLVKAIWVACAVRGGATYSEAERLVAGQVFGKPVTDAQNTLMDESAVARGKEEWVKTVNALVAHDMPRWYAMHMRKGVSYADLLKEIGETVRPVPELFYPSETIRKRVGNKLVMTDKPFISSTLFFRTFPDRILPMFSRIGDKAWCYRVSREAGAPYAVISGEDMRRFQAVIGVFTPDTEIHSIGELTPKPGEPVVIIKAGYGNRRGEIEEVIGEGTGSMIFRVKLSTDQGYEWRLDLSPQQIQRIAQ